MLLMPDIYIYIYPKTFNDFSYIAVRVGVKQHTHDDVISYSKHVLKMTSAYPAFTTHDL